VKETDSFYPSFLETFSIYFDFLNTLHSVLIISPFTLVPTKYLWIYLSSKILFQGGTGSAWKRGCGVWGYGEVAQIMYTNVNKCKNNKKK
jgi:hypothetical protein